MLLLILSISVTAIGPLVIALLKKTRVGARWSHEGDPEHLPRLVYLVVGLLAAVGIVPQLMRTLGYFAVVPMAGGLALAWIAHRLAHGHSSEAAGGAALAALALGGVALHSFLDGALLFSFGQPETARFLAPLVLLDRVTIGLVAWSLTAPLGGAWAGIASLLALAATTVAGYVGVEFVVAKLADDPVVGSLNAGLAGIVLYLILAHAKEHHRHDPFFHFDAKPLDHDHPHHHH